MSDNTRDLSKFGFRERQEAGKLLLALGTEKDKARFLGEDVAIEFNPNSGNVLLIDGDCNVALMNGDDLEDFFFCPECGHEGFLEDMKHKGNKECKDYLNQIKL